MRKILTYCLLLFPLIVVALVITKFSSENKVDITSLIELGFIPITPARNIGTIELPNTINQSIVITQPNDQWSVIYTGYTHCPDICPLTLSKFTAAKQRLQDIERLANTVHFMMITIDPKRDTAKALHRYINAFDSAISGFIPTEQQVDIIHLQFGLPPIDKSVFKIDHSKMHHSSLNNDTSKVPTIQPITATGYDANEIPHNDKVVVLNPQGKLVGYISPAADADKMAKILAFLIRNFPAN